MTPPPTSAGCGGHDSTSSGSSSAAVSDHDILALVVDSDFDRRARVRNTIRTISRRVDVAGDEAHATACARRDSYDLMVVAAELDTASGLLVVQRLRPLVDSAIVVTAASHSTATVVAAFEVGADDCCTGPTSDRELVMRARMAVDRRRFLPVITARRIIADARFEIDPFARRVVVAGVDIALTTKQFDLLYVLASTPGRVFTRAELLELVWGSSPEWQSPHTITEHVYRLRQRLSASSVDAEWVQSVRGTGYRFVAPSPHR